MTTYDVCSLDVWGNPEDGYEVNDVHKCGTVDLDDDLYDGPALVAMLVDAGYLTEACRQGVDVDWNDGLICIDDPEDGRPILQLRLAYS